MEELQGDCKENGRLITLKGQMYGRANFDLLRQRVIYAALTAINLQESHQKRGNPLFAYLESSQIDLMLAFVKNTKK